MQANVSVTPAGMEPMEGRRVSEFVVSALGRALRRGTAPSLMLRPGALLMGREAYSYISVTLNMRHKNDKNIKFLITRIFQVQNASKPVFERPQLILPSRLRKGQFPLATNSVSRTRRLG